MEKKERRSRIQIDYKKLGVIVAGVILFFLVMDLNSRLNELSRLSAQRDSSSTQVAILQGTLSHLETQIFYATSESSVEKWAYEEGHMALPGDKVIIPLSPPGVTEAPVVIPTAAPVLVSNWDIWMSLLFQK